MNVYLMIFLALFIFSIFEVSGQKKILAANNLSLNTVIFFTLAFCMYYVCTFRFEVGRDWKNYFDMFMYPDRYMLETENGYILVNRLFQRFGDNGFYLMQFVLMTFCCFVIYRSILKNNEFPIFILFIYFAAYFFGSEMEQFRQLIAMAILVYGERFTKSKKIFFWILTVLLAMQFHISAIIAFPIYFTDRIRIPDYLVFLFLGIFACIEIFGYRFVWMMLDIAVGLGFIPKRITFLLNRYMQSTVFGLQAQYSSGLGFIAKYTFYFMFAFLYLIDKSENKNGKYHITNFLIGVFFGSLARNFDQIGRLARYYLICGSGQSFYNILPASFKFFKKTETARLFLIVFYGLFTLYTPIIGDGRMFMPEYQYRSIFSR